MTPREVAGHRDGRRVLVACVGNIFLGDDGFGVEVARRLAGAEMPAGVRVVDYGTGGMHLAYDLAEGYGTAILVDASPRGGVPGTITVVEVDPAEHPNPAAASGALQGSMLFDGHGMQPDVIFGILEMLGAQAGRILVVGCEPASVGESMELSPPVAAAVDEAVRIVLDLAAAESTRSAPGAGQSHSAQSAGSKG
ncbi:MAG TPA: hydrogenase maturation protease [Streptosporangiaceae bacterium]|nr:hydrogenase maturation protease [Streptosporangiaceae bacterium]